MKKIFSFGRRKKQPPSLPSPGAYELHKKDLGKLHRAAASGDLSQMRRELKKDDIDGRDKEERTPLHLSCASGHVDIVTYLVENKCKLNLFDSANRSPLMKAVQCQQEKCAAILLEHGADPNLTDSDGNTALHFAVLSPKTSITEMLLDHNANIDAQNKEGYTPLSCAVSEHHEEIAELLLKKGADVHARDQSERTPLMIAASGGDLNLVKILLKYGADISHKDTSGWTAEDHAALNGYSSLRQHLAEYADLEDTGEASAGELSTPHRAGATGSMWGGPAMDRGGRILNRGGAHKRAIDDISQGDSIRSSEKPDGDDLLSWPSEEEEFDFSPKKPQNPNLVALLKASQLFRKSNDGEGSRIGSSNSSKKSFKQGSPSELLNQGNSRAGNLEVEDSVEEEEDDENFNGDEEEDYETEEEEEEEDDDEEEDEEEEEEEKKDENLTQHKKKEEDLEAEETESNDILEEEQGEKTEPKDEIQKLEHFSNTKYEGENLCGNGDVCDDKIRKELAEKVEESVGTPVSFIAGCYEKSQENTTAMSPEIMNNEASCKSVPKQSVFQKVNNFQGTQMSLNGKSIIQEKFHRNDDSCFADSENTDWKKEIPHPTSGSCGLKEKKSSFNDGFKSNNNSWSAAKNPRLKSERHNPNSVDLECMTDEKVSEAVKTESRNMPLNNHEENLRTVLESSNKVPCQQQEEEDSESPWDSEEELPEQEKEKEKVAKEDPVEDLGTAVAEGVKNAICNDDHQVCSPAKGNAGALSTAGAEEEDSESPWDSEEELPEQEKEKEKEAKEDPVEDLGTAVAEGVKNAVCNDDHQVCSPAKGNAGKCSESAISDEKEDLKDAIENYGDKYILETNILIENPAHENQTDKTEIAHREGLAENEESHSADKQLSPKPWEERYERMWVENEKRELKTNFKNITAELKQLFGEINETRKTTSLVEAMSENDCSEELKSSHVSSHVTESSNKLKSKGGCGDIKLRLGGKVPKMEIVIPSLSVLHDQNNLNDNMENTWSPDQNDSTKVPLAKRKEKKIHPMKIEGNENGSSRNVERSPEDSPRHSLKTSILDDVSNALAKIRPVSTCDENELLVTETKPGKGSEFYDYVPSDCLINSKKIGEMEIGSLFANAQPSCGMLKRNLDEELKQDMERFKSKVGMLQTVFLALEKENEQLQKEVEKEKSRPRYFQTQEVAKQEDLDKSNMMPGNITNHQMKQNLTLKKNDCLKMENENSVEEKDKNNFSSEERPKLIEMPVKGKFALNAKAAKKNRRHTSKQKASQQMRFSSGNYFPTLDDSTFSETSKDEKRPAAKTESEKNKVSIQMDVTDELDLTPSSDTTSEDVESPTSTYKEAMLLLEQLNVDQTGSTVLLKIQDILLEYEQMIEHEKNLNKAVCRELRKLKSKKESSQLIAEETQDLKSKLAHQEAEWKSDIQSLKCTLKQEEEKRLKVETLYEKTREKLTRKEDQYCKEMEEKQQLELKLRNLEMELIRLKKLLKQVEEERDEAQRQLSQEKNARVLQEGILKNQFWRQKEQNSEESAEREKDLLYKNQLLKDDIAKLRLEIDQLRRKFLEEEGKYLEENETLKEKNEDLKKELKQKEEALTQTAFQYHGQLNLLKTESAVLTSKLEQTKESKERLETEMASFSSRLTSTVQELERHQSSKDEAERAFNREREEWLRLQEKLLHDLSVVRETNKSCSQQLSAAESKANGLENELHQLKQTLREKTLLLEITQKELSQAQCQAKECDRAQQLEKDRVSKYIIKQESMQERLAQLQSENLLFRQQLEDMQNKGIMKEKAVNDVHDWFNDIFNKLRADTEKQVSLVEERNKELNVKCAELREQVFKYETNSAEREGMVRQLQQELADALKKQSMSEASLEVTTRYRSDLEEDKLCLQKELEKVQTKVYNRLEDLITGLQTAQAAAEDQQQQQCESERKLAELKHPFELSLEQEIKRNTELQKECMRLKRLLSKAMKKLRLHEENECELNVQGGLKKRYSEMANEVDRLRTKVGELTQQLEIESKKCIQLEIQNQDLQEELSTMRGSHEKLKKSKCQLKEEVATLKHRLEASVVDRSQMEQYKREVEEQAAQEIRQKLQEVNIFLQTQAASQDRIEQIRDSHHASLRNQLKQRITELECELDRIKYAQQDSIFQKESTWAEVERYKVLYQEELKMRRCLENKLERANAKLLRERDRSQSLITSSIVNGGLATSPLVYSTDLGHLASSLSLNRSLSIGGSYINTAGNALTSRSSVEAFVTKVRQELDETISKVVEQATTELETGSPRASSEGPVTGSSNISTLTSIPFPEQYRNTMMF